MNKIYKLKWDVKRNTWIVCSELCSAVGKSRKIIRTTSWFLLGAVSLLGSTQSIYALEIINDTNLTNTTITAAVVNPSENLTIINNGDLNFTNALSTGVIKAESYGGDIFIENNGDIFTTGFASIPISATQYQGDGGITIDINSTINATASSIIPGLVSAFNDSSGNGDVTINVSSTGKIIQSNATNSFRNYAVIAQTVGTGDINVTLGGALETNGQDSSGIRAQAKGTGDINLSIENTAAITTNGSDADGVYAESLNGEGDITIQNDGVIHANSNGDYTYGIVALGSNGVISITNNGVVESSGNASAAILAHSNEFSPLQETKQSSVSIVNTGTLVSNGSNSSTINATSNDSITISNMGDISASQVASNAIAAFSNEGDVTIENTGTISSGQGGSSIYIQSISSKITNNGSINGTIITSSGNDEVYLNDGSSFDGDIYLNDGSDKLTVYESTYDMMRNFDGGASNGFDTLIFSGGTHNVIGEKLYNWESVNISSGTELVLAGGGLNIVNAGGGAQNGYENALIINEMGTLSFSTEAYSINGSVINAGTVKLPSSNGIGLLTINGNYLGNNGTISFDTELYDDSSITDKLIVNGDTDGNSYVSVRNIGGSGAQTIEGIELIQVSGQSRGEFSQSGRIVAGAYDYFLSRGRTDTNNGNWYLSSLIPTPIIVNPPVDPVDPVDPEPANPPTIRPEVGSYIHNLVAANTMFVTRLHDRLGETRYIDELTGEEKVTSLWLRQVGGHNQWKTSDDQLKTQSNRYIAQMGGDIAQWTTNAKDRLHVGLMAGYGNDHNRTTSYLTGYRSNGSVEGYSLGLYGTWYQNNLEKMGLYVDSWAQYNWFKNKVSGAGLPVEEYDADGLTASIESGYAFKMRTDKKAGEKTREWIIEPKAQVVLMNVKSDEHVEENGTVANGLGDGNVMIRIGARSYANFYDEGRPRDGTEFQPFIEYNFIHNTKPFGVKMNDTSLFQEGNKNIGEVKFGVESKVNENVHLWGSIAVQFGSNGYEDNSAIIGAKWVGSSTNQMETTSQVSTIQFGGEKRITENLSLTGDVGMQLGSNGRDSQSAMLGMKYLIN